MKNSTTFFLLFLFLCSELIKAKFSSPLIKKKPKPVFPEQLASSSYSNNNIKESIFPLSHGFNIPFFKKKDNNFKIWDLKKLNNFVHKRFGGSFSSETKPVFWYSQGQLINSISGDIIAHIEGVEVSNALPPYLPEYEDLMVKSEEITLFQKQEQKNKYSDKYPIQEIEKLLKKREDYNEPRVMALYPIFTHRLYFHFNPQTGELLRSLPYGSRKKIRPIPSFTSVSSLLFYGIDEDGNLISQSIQASGAHVRGKCTIPPHPPSTSGKKEKKSVPTLSSSNHNAAFPINQNLDEKNRQMQKNVFQVSWNIRPGEKMVRPFSRIIQFGSPPAVPKCKESYIMISEGNPLLKRFKSLIRPNKESNLKLRYIRNGEGPFWCGPNRSCTLILESLRFNKYKMLPSSFKALIDNEYNNYLNEKTKEKERNESNVMSIGEISQPGQIQFFRHPNQPISSLQELQKLAIDTSVWWQVFKPKNIKSLLLGSTV